MEKAEADLVSSGGLVATAPGDARVEAGPSLPILLQIFDRGRPVKLGWQISLGVDRPNGHDDYIGFLSGECGRSD